VSDPVTDETRVPAAGTGFREQELAAVIPRLRRYALVLTGNPARGDDLVQDTLTRAWDKRSYWRAGSDLRAWLFTIMHNVFVNQLAGARRDAANVSLDAEGENGTAFQVPTVDDPTRRIELQEVMGWIRRLPAEQREVLMRVAVEGMRYEEVAVALGIPVGTVMSRLSRAREKLKRMSEQQAVAPEAAGERGR
jgi:RNA polymerase sigma-70 factor (ECF subfamily)